MAIPAVLRKQSRSCESKHMELYIHDGASTLRFVVLGSLEEAAARELERSWRTAESVTQGRCVLVDVTGLTGIDDIGLAVLTRMRNSGCQVHARRMPKVSRVAHLVEATAPESSDTGVARKWITSLAQLSPFVPMVLLTLFLVHEIGCGLDGSRNGARGLYPSARPSGEGVVKAARSVCLIQGSYAFRDAQSGQLLRRSGWLLDGDSSLLEKTYSGTGFLVSSHGAVVTNRHIAQPWSVDAEARQIVAAGYKPEFTSLKAYFPGRNRWYSLTPQRFSTTRDVALLQTGQTANLPDPLSLDDSPQISPGDRIVLIGFPGGVGPILGRYAEANHPPASDSLNIAEDQLTQALAAQDQLEPFISFGHVSNVSGSLLTLAAQTSDGSSGSPVLNESGAVIGILSASLTRVDGGSLAVPVQSARELMRRRSGG